MYHVTELLGEQRQATRDNVQRRQARTEAEREDDGEDVASGECIHLFCDEQLMDNISSRSKRNFSVGS